MSKREEKRKLKLCVLSRIKEHKDVLFGELSKTSIKGKAEAWQEVYNYAKSIGAIGQDKDWKYLRDVWFPNVRRTAVEKIEKKVEKTEENAEKPDSVEVEEISTHEVSTINEVDEFILDLIGKDPGIKEDEEVAELKKKKLELMKQNVERASYLKSLKAEGELDLKIQNIKQKGSGLKTQERYQAEDVLIPLKKKKLELMIENLEKDSYLKSLQIVKMERELDLPHSNFTLTFQEENFVQENVVYLTTEEDSEHQ